MFIQRSILESRPVENLYTLRIILCAMEGNIRDLDYLSTGVNRTLSCSICAVVKVSPVRVHEQERPTSDPMHTGCLASGSPPMCFTPTLLMRSSTVWGGTSESLNFVKDGGGVSNLTPRCHSFMGTNKSQTRI